jgi:hypothetical protein
LITGQNKPFFVAEKLMLHEFLQDAQAPPGQQQPSFTSYDVFKLNQENWSHPALSGPNQILPDDFRYLS